LETPPFRLLVILHSIITDPAGKSTPFYPNIRLFFRKVPAQRVQAGRHAGQLVSFCRKGLAKFYIYIKIANF